MKPETLSFAKTHEWVAYSDQNGQRIATIGISAFAVEQLTDLVYIDLPQVGQAVTAGESFGEIESVKAVSDLYSPVTGEVVEVNSALSDNLELFSDDPYGRGWIARSASNGRLRPGSARFCGLPATVCRGVVE